MAVAPLCITGMIWCRYTVSVTAVPLCPTNREISSRGTSLADRSETKLCRSSRGVQSLGGNPAFLMTRRKDRRTLWESKAVPTRDTKTRSVDAGGSLNRLRCVRMASTHRCGMASRRRDFLVVVSPLSRTERNTDMDGGTGGLASGLPIKSTSAHVSARSSSVRAPIRSESTMYAYKTAPTAAASTASA